MVENIAKLITLMSKLDVGQFHVLRQIIYSIKEENFEYDEVMLSHWDFIESVHLLGTPQSIINCIDRSIAQSLANQLLRNVALLSRKKLLDDATSPTIITDIDRDTEEGIWVTLSPSMMSLLAPLKDYCADKSVDVFFDEHFYREEIAQIKLACDGLSQFHRDVLAHYVNNYRCLSAGMFDPSQILGLTDKDCESICPDMKRKTAREAVIGACEALFNTKVELKINNANRQLNWFNTVNYDRRAISVWGEPILFTPLLFANKDTVKRVFGQY